MGWMQKNKMEWMKGLMLFSQVLLLLFTAQWMISQYNDQQEQLKKNLTKLFVDVQQRITDSIMLSQVIDTSYLSKPFAAGVMPGSCNEENDERNGQKVTLSPQGIHRILSGASISRQEEKRLFRMDSIVFNELFVNQMKQNGWNFNSTWINNADSNKKGSNAIFINSTFFTSEKGVVIGNYQGYIFWKLVPQMFFVAVLLTLTGAAFWVTFRSLKAQIKLSALKDDFISNMSHELKTPIATVKVALEALNNFNVIDDPKRGREYLGMATSEMDRLELLATRVLNTSLLESGKIYIQQESYDFKKLVEEVLQALQLRIAQQGARVSFEATGSSFVILMDKLHMQGVLVNLIDNSLKYGEAPVNINIHLTESHGRVQLSHTDNGPGIPEEYREKVFEKFFRVPTGNRHNTKGHGLGLSYAAQVMRQHNGSINVNNIAEGGCVFTLSF